MTLRTRLVVLTTIAVAAAIVAASVSAWLLIRWSLMDQVDQQLLERREFGDQIAVITPDLPQRQTNDRPGDDARVALQNEPIGVQLIDIDGEILHRISPGDIDIPLDQSELMLLDAEIEDEHLHTVTVNDTRYRVMSTTLRDGRLLRLIYPLDTVEATMTRIAWLLAGVASIGIVAAGGLGWVTVRAGLRPVDKLVDAAERVANTRDLAHRIHITGNDGDDVVRLANSLNAMLAALESARTQQRELVENAGHELRTPLATLRNDLGLLVRIEQNPERSLAPEDRARLLNDLESEAVALSELVQEIVDLARGDTQPEPQLEVDLRILVERAVARTRRINPNVSVDVHGRSVEATVRPEMLERAVANLVRNAVQVSRDGDTVVVDLTEQDGWASVRVLDRGPGIAERDMPRLFDRFYRGEEARERHGSGLGLAIVAQIAELHGGRVEATNRDEGGAMFAIHIPMSPPD